MDKIIAVDDKLTNVREALQAEGYRVLDLHQGIENCAAIVVSGMDDNLLGQQDIVTRVPVIDATGRDVDDIVEAIARSIELQK